jgi:hypothetical protein
MDIDDEIIDNGVKTNDWSTCPNCGTRLMGFTDDMMHTAVKLVIIDVKSILNRLQSLDIRMNQIAYPEHLRGYIEVDGELERVVS